MSSSTVPYGQGGFLKQGALLLQEKHDSLNVYTVAMQISSKL